MIYATLSWGQSFTWEEREGRVRLIFFDESEAVYKSGWLDTQAAYDEIDYESKRERSW